ncbi:Serine/threonine kinase [Mucor velutinosus]|uniref:Serine/threonine kinase n=1 Tax=Mucor velutinosus TaxID=708070 RepID=A0AAN7HTY9_9FUNG|nr:Serine/threonine kinase [Mucor velutinosus]
MQGNSPKRHVSALNAHNNYPTSNTAICKRQDTMPYHQKTQASDPAQPMNMMPLSAPSNTLNKLSKTNISKAAAAAAAATITTAASTPQQVSNGHETENTNASSNTYQQYRDSRMSHSSVTTHVLPSLKGEQSRKRTFDQTEHSSSKIQGNSRKSIILVESTYKVKVQLIS